MRPVISVQGWPEDRSSWLDLAREVEAAGLEALVAADHPGTVPAPFVALAAAAAVTDRIKLGTYVLNAGMWEPLALANEIATLDVVSGGRSLLGVGAGHTPKEWSMTGRRFPTADQRVTHLEQLVEATRALLAGETVSQRSDTFALVDASLEAPRSVKGRIPLLIGGNGTRVLRLAARRADIIGITGLGRTLADGHHHGAEWSAEDLRRIVDIVGPADDQQGGTACLDALVQHIEITDDAEAAAERLSGHIEGVSATDLLTTPFMWLGTVEEIRTRLRTNRESWGIERYTIRSSALAAARRILDGFDSWGSTWSSPTYSRSKLPCQPDPVNAGVRRSR